VIRRTREATDRPSWRFRARVAPADLHLFHFGWDVLRAGGLVRRPARCQPVTKRKVVPTNRIG